MPNVRASFGMQVVSIDGVIAAAASEMVDDFRRRDAAEAAAAALLPQPAVPQVLQFVSV